MSRVPDLPCATCGKRMWRGRTSLPAGQATCRECRRATWQHGTRKGYRENACRCDECRAWNAAQFREYKRSRRAQGRPIPKRSWVAVAVRNAVYERDGWLCWLCGGATNPDADPQDDWYPSLDHVVPHSKGGGRDVDNLKTAHRWCNAIRGAEDYHLDLLTG